MNSDHPPQVVVAPLDTPLGEMVMFAQDTTLVALTWREHIERTKAHLQRHLGPWHETETAAIAGITQAIGLYFDGDVSALNTISIEPPGTPFQRTVWAALRTIPVGSTLSYQQVAHHIGRPKAVRAVANANGRNPIPLVVPCHRVIASDGSLGGYSAGLHRKPWLLKHESAFTG